MIAKFHKWTKLPIDIGEPLAREYGINGHHTIRRARRDDDHHCFSAEKIISHEVYIRKVNSPIGIYLAFNYFKYKCNINT